MSKSMALSITIGAVLSSAFTAATGGVEKTLDRLGKTTAALTGKQVVLGKAIKDGISQGRNISGLQDRYNRLGAAIEKTAASQRRLNDLMTKGAAIRRSRKQMRGDMMEAGATAAAMGAPVLASVRKAGGFEDTLRDIRITGEMSRSEELALGSTMRDNAIRFNQTQDDIAAGIGTLVAGGIQSAGELTRFAPVLAKTATATRASMDDLGAVLLSMRNSLHVSAQDSESALNMLAYAGKRGQFEIRDMAKSLPQLAPMLAGLGVTGKECY